MTEREGLPSTWPASIRTAWEYMVSSVYRELGPTEALRQYRAGGGEIRRGWWFAGRKAAVHMVKSGEMLLRLPGTYQIPKTMFEESGFDWRSEYILQAEVVGTDPFTGAEVSRWVTVESDVRLTLGEYQTLAQQAIDMTPGSVPIIIQKILGYNPYHRIPAV